MEQNERGGDRMRYGKKTIAALIVASIGLSLLAGVAAAAGRVDPIAEILGMLGGIQPQHLKINIQTTVPPYSTVFMLLPEVEGQTYSGQLTFTLLGYPANYTVYAIALVRHLRIYIATATLTERYVNVGFACEGLELLVVNDLLNATQVDIVGVTQYTTSTNGASLSVTP
jgi:hypothetical protein